MKRMITASLLDTFMKYHEDEDNYSRNRDGFDKMYEILNHYGNEDEDVDVVFSRATPADQERMVALINPGPEVGSVDWFRDLYHRNVIEKMNGRQYAEGFQDALFALSELGYVDEIRELIGD